MDRKRVTQQQILDRTGINRSTLREWRLKGIIPPGTLGVHPTKGRGRVLTYSPATAFKIEMLVNIRRTGFSLEEAVVEFKKQIAARVNLVNQLSLKTLLKARKTIW
jgi:DNA-binding transcriptional MerR regulator